LVILIYLAIAGMLVTAVLALWKGGAPERLGVIIYAVINIVFQVASTQDSRSLLYSYETLGADLLIATGFLIVALRYSSLWLAGAMVAQGLATAIHGFHLEDEQINQKLVWMGVNVWIVANNVISSVVFWMLLGGTIATWRNRRRVKRAAKESAKLIADALSGGAHLAA